MIKNSKDIGLAKSEFEDLFKTYFVGLSAFAQKYVKDIDSAKEIVHDVFVNLWNKRATIDPKKSLKSYLFTAVKNRCLNKIRDDKKFDTSIEDLDTVSNQFKAEDQDHLELAELEQKIHSILMQLPEKCRAVFILSRYEGKKYKEISQELNIAQKTVETHISKALKALRLGLGNYLKLCITAFIIWLNKG